MYTNQDLDSVVSRLSSFTFEELNYLKTKIDLILGEKAITDLSINQSESEEDSSNSRIVMVGGKAGIDAFVKKLVIDIKSDINTEIEDIKPAKKHRRPSGMWKGKVKMPDNFDELSNDILADFGID
ncbi:hypothetical protein NOS3756_29810 [Nostoc sp. NIES-3756]|uniref:hypothetical protein n=1 Tax=Nostoc sp. NIES-3756 TaxID=1751286 RepID=UPI000721E27F|nr:hypothetical protein [Nostoc sp. NIES-3756]BAT54016.1 hypothetical protein NOS3756_29810 [Nostoc sp. NIES-3756]